MLEAAKELVLILVDCSSKVPPELNSKFQVGGFPTIKFTDSQGNIVGELGDRSASGVATQFQQLAAKHSKRAPWAESLDAALASAKEGGKPVLLFVADEKKESSPHVESHYISDEVKESIGEFVLARHVYAKDCVICQTLKLKGGAVSFVLNPRLEAPLSVPVEQIKPSETPKKFRKELESALKEWKKLRATGETAGQPSQGGEKSGG